MNTLKLNAALLFLMACSSKDDPVTPQGSGGAGGAQEAGAPANDGATAPQDAAGTSPEGASDALPPSAPLLPLTTGRFPAQSAMGVCADAPLRLTFASPVKVGTSGKVQVFKASQPATPVDAINLADTMFADDIGGRHFLQTKPIFIDGADAIIYLHNHKLVGGEKYFVTIESGVFLDAATSAPVGSISAASDWTFTTKVPAPASVASLTVAREGGGDFCTVQGAIDFIPAMNADPVTVTIKKGTYHEIVAILQKKNITLHGEDRKGTIIAYPNNNTLQAMGGTKTRAMVEVEQSDGLVVENMTLHNTTPQGGSQAEALRVEPSDKVILRDDDFISTQDTLLLTGRVYVSNCYVEGNVDFIWGKGTAYFDKCELKTVGRTGYEVQARNNGNVYGYVFVDTKLTSDPGITGNMLGRIEVTQVGGYQYSSVAYVNCQMDKHIDPKAWVITSGDATPLVDNLKFWEYKSTDLAGLPVDVSMRHPASKQIDDATAAMMRDKVTVLAGWNPITGTDGDAGADARTDPGADAGTDARIDAGADARIDAGADAR